MNTEQCGIRGAELNDQTSGELNAEQCAESGEVTDPGH